MSADDYDEDDLGWTIKPKSDQLNADNLIAGPITVRVAGVKVRRPKQGEQPVVIRLEGGHMPYIPCLTMRKALVTMWGTKRAEWVGRWLTLFRDPTVNSPDGTKGVGGIRISHVSHIDRPVKQMLTETRGKKKEWVFRPLNPPDQRQQGAPTADLDALLEQHGLTRPDVDRWLKAKSKPTLDAAPERVPQLAAYLGGNPASLAEIRALILAADTEPEPDADTTPLED